MCSIGTFLWSGTKTEQTLETGPTGPTGSDEPDVGPTGCNACTAAQYCDADQCFEKMPIGSECVSTGQCQNGLGCRLGTNGSMICQTYASAGASCTASTDCDSRQNLRCGSTTSGNKKCIPSTFSFTRPRTVPCPTDLPPDTKALCEQALVCLHGVKNDFFYDPAFRNPDGTVGKYIEGYSCRSAPPSSVPAPVPTP